MMSVLAKLSIVWSCDMVDPRVKFAWLGAKALGNFGLWRDAAYAALHLPKCTDTGVAAQVWYKLSGRMESFDVCNTCFMVLLRPLGLGGIFHSMRYPAAATSLRRHIVSKATQEDLGVSCTMRSPSIPQFRNR
ncbi:hypothetical protein V1524DRAFT_441905 [Lipomyces starkeyi]